LAGCGTIASLTVPPAEAPASQWNAPLPHGGRTAGLAAWWQSFHDNALAELQQGAQDSNPDLDRARAAIRRARADLVTGRASSRPQLGLSSSLTRSGDVNDGAYTATGTSHRFDASWETDLFGRNARTVAALDAERDARGAEWHYARVSISAEVATDYIDYRSCRQRALAYRNQDASYRKTLALTDVNVAAGFISRADARLTAAGAAGAAANVVAEEARCETLIKALVALTGLEEMRVRTILGEDRSALPGPENFAVDSVPAYLLRQRPDLAAADRRLAAAYQRIGAAQAARWPDLRLNGTIGLAHALATAASPWSIASTITLPVYSAGGNAARIDAARADYDSVLAEYQGQIRKAVQEVEVALVNLDSATRREQDVAASAANYRAYFQSAEIDWKAGRRPLLDLETARRNAVNAELLDIDVKTARVEQWVALYKALGGGWNRKFDVAPIDEETE
jgi:NodT family efflux transporter outer membrane factor (OMF) lipoprotein